MRGHFANLAVYSGVIAAFFAVLTRRNRKDQLRFAVLVWLSMVLGVLLLAYLMYPFPR